MIVYSKRIIKFVNEIKTRTKEILAFEIRVKVLGDRFIDVLRACSYPISVVVYNNKSMLGYFDPSFFELGFHETLMHVSREQLDNIIRHELAHYMLFIQSRGGAQPHSNEFREFCRSKGWGEEVYRATFSLENAKNSYCDDNGILRKIQKLMALTASSNPNEAELAMVKSQQLLLKHNLESKSISELNDEKVFLIRIMKQKKEDAKMRAIAKILETFFVSIVYSRHEGYTYLEVLGSGLNIEIAEYVSEILQSELDHLWKLAQKQHGQLKGKIAKNSFLLGIAKGYCEKINALKRDYSGEIINALTVIEKNLAEAQSMAYPRLRMTKTTRNYCQESSALGERMGKQLNINPAVKSSMTHGGLLEYAKG
ncbi:MAG: DUF2786 domain-containing protein [Parachlamydiaceae bacterium]|nr:DUF2786 domain-containing protein [Parachlamydiaceae bacterium]